MENYSITIGYRAVIGVNVKADSEEEAKKKGLEYFRSQNKKMFQNENINLQDDTYDADGVLNMDNTWNIL